MSDADQSRPAGIYARLSLAIMGDTTHVDDQVRIVRPLLGPNVHIDPRHVWKDNSRSAWRLDRKRPAWDAMLVSVDRGELVNGLLGLYHGDRMARQPRDLEDLIDAGAPHCVTLVFPTGRYNLADPDHQMMLRWIVARARNEIDNMSRRLKDSRRRRWEQGKVRGGGRGGRPFGFETDGETHVLSEVLEIQKAAPRVLAAEATGTILAEWNARGLRTTAGGLWTHGTFKAMMLRPRYAGLMPDGESTAAWEPVLDRETWEGVKAVLENRAALFGADTTRARHLLSGIAICEPCGHTLEAGHGAKKQLIYRCKQRGCMRIVRSLPHVDEFVIGHVLELLANKTYIAALQEPDDPTLATEITALEARKGEAEEQLRRLVDNPHVKPELLVASLEGFDRRIGELRERIGLSARRRMLIAHAGLTDEKWDDLPLETQRTLVRSCVEVTVLPVGRRGPGFDASKVRVVPLLD